MPAPIWLRRAKKRHATQLKYLIRQLVSIETGAEEPSPTFIRDYLVGLHGRNYDEDVNYADDLPRSTSTAGSDTTRDITSHGLDLSTAAARYRRGDYTLDSLAGLAPSHALAKQIVQEVMGIADASPTMIHDIMRDAGLPIARSGAPSPEPYHRRDNKVYTEDHIYICQCEVDGTDIAFCTHTDREVTVLEHDVGVNDLATGALLTQDGRGHSSSSPIRVVPISLIEGCRLQSRRSSSSGGPVEEADEIEYLESHADSEVWVFTLPSYEEEED